MLGGIGPMELIIIFLIVILLFGGKKIPEIAKGLGKGIRDFKSSMAGNTDAEDEAKAIAKPDAAKSSQENPKT
jgi:sec-independent protein translocase protein TatA